MEAVLLRFPHIGYQIFENLNNPFLTVSRNVSQSWKSFIDNGKLTWIRKIVYHIKPLTLSWKKFFEKSNVILVAEMATSVIQYFKYHPEDKGLINTVPLHFAAMTGNTEMIERLIQIGAKLNEIDSAQCTPLHYAARYDQLTAYQVIMENNPIINPECGYMTPFHIAAEHGHLSICKLIIDKVEDKNPRNVDRETPLLYAVQGGFYEICKLIIDNDLIDKNPRDESGNTPLHDAALSGNLAIVKLIFNNIQDKNPPGEMGTTPLHLAATSGVLEVFQFIFDNIEDKNPGDHIGFTPLHIAAEQGFLSICQLIIENIVENNPPDDAGGLTPLHMAASRGHYETCKLFMEKIENKNPRVIHVGTPLDLAARHGHLKICKLIQCYLNKYEGKYLVNNHQFNWK